MSKPDHVIRLSALICLLALLLLLGFVRNKYLVIWEFGPGFLLVERELHPHVDSQLLLAQLPSLIFYFGIYYTGNAAVLWLYTNEEVWWKKVLWFYSAGVLFYVLIMVLGFFIKSSMLFNLARTIKESLLSPLPSLILIPILYWQQSQLK